MWLLFCSDSSCRILGSIANISGDARGYVAVAVSTAGRTYTREADTESNERQANMVGFAAEALKLLRDVIQEKAAL